MKDDRTYEDRTNRDIIDGIVCDVTNCIYNEDNKNCTASQIKVGPNFAATKSDTACVTFEHR